MSKQPDLPQPAYPDLDSMLSRKFGKEVANYFSGSPLNRVGFLRSDNAFLSRALKHPSTSFMLCNELQPLVKEPSHLAYASFEDVKPIIGDDPYMQTEDELVAAYDSSKAFPQMIFLGIDEKRADGLEYTGKNTYKGAAYFALDVSPKGDSADVANSVIKKMESKGLSFAKGRMMELEAADGMWLMLERAKN